VVIQVRVKTSSPKVEISFKDEVYTVSLKSTPLKNKANIELIDLLSSYFNTSKSSVKILRGFKSKRKLVEIFEK
jgi:uncharacterized protein YggU (UPF0235/DUF167 family)